MQQVNYKYFLLNAVKIWTQKEKVVKLYSEIIYERNFKNNVIVFFSYY